jgi:hypothetical protein
MELQELERRARRWSSSTKSRLILAAEATIKTQPEPAEPRSPGSGRKDRTPRQAEPVQPPPKSMERTQKANQPRSFVDTAAWLAKAGPEPPLRPIASLPSSSRSVD